MRKSIILATGLALIAGTAALAAEPYLPRSEKSFARADANKDGKLALAEFTPLADRALTRLDGNGDKAVTQVEIETKLQEALHRRVERIMTLMDADRNGTITGQELDKLVADMFNSADDDKDGGLSMAEVRGFKRGLWRKAYLTHVMTGSSNGN